MISVVMSVLSVAVRIRIFRFGRVRSSGSHSVQIELVMVGVHRLSVRLTLVKFVVARLSTVVAHVRHGRLRESWRILGVRVAAHRSGKVGQNAGNLFVVCLSGAHDACPALRNGGDVQREPACCLVSERTARLSPIVLRKSSSSRKSVVVLLSLVAQSYRAGLDLRSYWLPPSSPPAAL